MHLMSNIKDYMVTSPYSVQTGTIVQEAVELMKEHGIRHLPVKEGDRLVGIFSDRDIMSASFIDDALKGPVENIMVHNPRSFRDDTPLEEVIRAMDEEGIGSAIVIDSQRAIVGIFTEKDAIRAFAQYLASDTLAREIA
jgi:acetoin utilization protein AcuB